MKLVLVGFVLVLGMSEALRTLLLSPAFPPQTQGLFYVPVVCALLFGAYLAINPGVQSWTKSLGIITTACLLGSVLAWGLIYLALSSRVPLAEVLLLWRSRISDWLTSTFLGTLSWSAVRIYRSMRQAQSVDPVDDIEAQLRYSRLTIQAQGTTVIVSVSVAVALNGGIVSTKVQVNVPRVFMRREAEYSSRIGLPRTPM